MAKQIIFTLLILSFGFAANAQTRKPYRTDRPAVSITNECKELSQHVWWGVDNRFRIIIEGANCDSISITSEYFNFEYLGDCYYNVTVKDTSYKGSLDVFIKVGNKTINTVWYWSFLPKPEAHILIGHGPPNILHHPIVADYHNPRYHYVLGNCATIYGNRNFNFYAISYTAELIINDTSTGKWDVQGQSLYPIKEHTRLMKKGDKIIFTNVMVKGPDGIIREAYGFEYIVE